MLASSCILALLLRREEDEKRNQEERRRRSTNKTGLTEEVCGGVTADSLILPIKGSLKSKFF